METPTNLKKSSLKNYWTKFRSLFKFFFRTRRPFRLTRGGWIFILYTIGVGAGAINTGNNLLYLVFGLFLGLILASGVLSDLSLWGVVPEPSFPLSGRAGEPLYLPFKLTNTKRWFPSVSVRIEMEATLHDESLTGQAYCSSIEKSAEASTLLVVHPRARGKIQIQKLKLMTRFPFGLLTKSWNMGEETAEVLIYPALLPIQLRDVQFSLDAAEAQWEWPSKGEGANLYGIRDYQASDNPRKIHWRASAKRAMDSSTGPLTEWLVKEMEQERDEEIFFSWPDPLFFKEWSEIEEETFVSFTASLVEGLERSGKNPVLIIYQNGTLSRIEKEMIWEYLALVDVQESLSSEIMQNRSETPVTGLDMLFLNWKQKNAA